MEIDLKEELNRRMTAAWAAFAPVREATDQLTEQDLRSHLFDSTVLLKFNRRIQHLAGLRSSDLGEMSRLRDPAEFISKAKHNEVGHITRRIDDNWTKRTLEWISRDENALKGDRDGATCSLHGCTS
ncbi:hypothetical protein RB195_017478 [Necator americanus]|uniref:Uncharacterized protein n=1 Tax=Necator americanus TaxID=51031 RepID=A0ABR1C5G0_NECAM